MAHNCAHDFELLRWLVGSKAFHLGALGPRRRTERFVVELRASLSAESADSNDARALVERLHAPIGLDIGADNPEQIALAVAAEIQAVCAGHGGGFLRDGVAWIETSAGIARSALECGVKRRFGFAADSNEQLNHPKRRFTPHSKALRATTGVVAPGAHADRLRCELDGLDVAIVENRNWRDGIGSSIRVGVGHLRSVVPTVK